MPVTSPLSIKLTIAWLMLAVGLLADPAFAQTSKLRSEPPRFGIVCKDAGAGAYEAFPDVCRTRSGELLCVFYAGFSHVSPPGERLPGGARIAMCRSKDDGLTWSRAETVVDTPIDDRDPSIVELPGGDLLVSFMTYDLQRTRGTHQAFTVRSSDAGKTWSQPKPIDTPFTQLEAVSTPPRLMPDGRLLLTPYGNNTGDPRSYKHAAVLESRDDGRSWKTLSEIKSKQHMLLEPDLVRLPDGRLLVMMRSTMTWSESTDGGHTWTDPRAGRYPRRLSVSTADFKRRLALRHPRPRLP